MLIQLLEAGHRWRVYVVCAAVRLVTLYIIKKDILLCMFNISTTHILWLSMSFQSNNLWHSSSQLTVTCDNDGRLAPHCRSYSGPTVRRTVKREREVRGSKASCAQTQTVWPKTRQKPNQYCHYQPRVRLN